MRRLFTVIYVILLQLFLYACILPPTVDPGNPTGVITQTSTLTITFTQTSTETASASPTANPSPTTINPTTSSSPLPQTPNPVINPLTGKVVSDPGILERRPIAVKVQLFPRGQRPPYGLSRADIVYDYYQNNGVTRLTAIFYGENAEQVGPVRSARLFDEEIIKMYEAIFIFGLAESRIYEKLNRGVISNRLVVEKYGSCPPLCRIDPDSVNHLVLNTEQLNEYLTKLGIPNEKPELNGMVFSDQIPGNGSIANQVFIRISFGAYNRWDYDPKSGRYFRLQDTVDAPPGEEVVAPLTDQLTEQPIAFDNVVVLFMGHRYAYDTQAGEGEVFEINYNKKGDAYAFRDGYIYRLYWHAPSEQIPIQLTFPDGKEYPLKSGKTWYQIVGKTSNVEEPAAGFWRIDFQVP